MSLFTQTLLEKEQVALSEILTVESVRLTKLLFYAIVFLDGFYVVIDKWNTVRGPLEKKECLVLIKCTYKTKPKNNSKM